MVVVAILSGSASDAAIVDKTAAVLARNGITYDTRVISAHREPDTLDQYIKTSDCKIFIAIAGLSAALPGVIASKTEKPVIGVPVSGNMMGGLDALLSIVQMPRGVPVACVGLDNGENAALLAIRMLSIQ
ncbi:MAG: N5-carboxyaminoimidazole ribonucleotide mutase [Methanoregulaceae archaeon PtaU1.Bin222]|nr:MAG: N5-carboxyaminoimidazole ribonucleotide mutase [Methanoregulaceae archaeon PtaU1.Bin222]